MLKRSYTIISLLLAVALCLSGFFSACSSGGQTGEPPAQEQPGGNDPGGNGPGEEPQPPEDTYPDELFEGKLYNTSKVGMSAEYLGTMPRSLPEVSDGGLGAYPQYGVTLSATEEEKQAILDENQSLVASASTYDSMDAEGNLFLAGEPTGRKLYRHTASSGMYEGDVSDSEPALVKRLTYRSRSRGNLITGLYAPAGEVIKIELSAEDLAETGGLTVYIGQVLVNGSANNIWLARDFNRMPYIANSMSVQQETAYVGSFLGGPVYIAPNTAGAEFSVTISGAVAYSHYIHGYTTEEEFERNSASSAPYFDLEVWDDGVRHSGPKARAERFDYDELADAAVLWDKIALVSNRVPSGSGGDTGIVFLYDPFVAAGSMVAFVGRWTVNCPLYVMEAALDVESAVDDPSDAFWGAIHEFNHHFQRFGFHPGDEVTNNAVSLVEYSLFTRVSQNRAAGGADEGKYAVGWNRYTNPSWSLRQTLAASGENSGLDSYANLLHAFGQDAFIRAAQAGGGRGGADAWFAAVCDATGYDMTYYFTELLGQTVSQGVLSEYAQKDLPMFVPAASVYQTGRSYTAGGKICFSRTAQPYAIPTGEPFSFDLQGSIVLPEGFAFEIKSVSAPAYGSLSQQENGTFLYTPDAANRTSGKIFVTLSVEKTDGAFEVEDVMLVLEFRQSQAAPGMLERTVYTYAAENMYASAEEAWEKGYAGYETVSQEDNENRVQNGNAEIWEPDPSSNAVMEISGKFRIESTGKYRVAVRGRRSAALCLSTDGEKYELVASVENTAGSADFTGEEGSYVDRTFRKGQWVHFKAVLLVTDARSFIGVGLGKFSGENVRVSYLNAYRSSYFREPFESDYFYGRDYSYDGEHSGKGTLLSAQYSPWDENYSIGNLFDGNDANFIHSDHTPVSESSPFEVEVDLGRVMTADTFTIYGEGSRQYQPKTFRLYAGTSAGDMQLIADVENAVRTGSNVILSFPARAVRFYRLVVTDTWDDRIGYIAYRYAEFSLSLPGGTLYSPDEELFVYRGGWEVQGALAPFGHVYSGENATLGFTFTGTRFALFSLPEGAGAFEVLIDGEVSSGTEHGGGDGLSYLSEELSAGVHTVLIRSREKFNISAVALWEQ